MRGFPVALDRRYHIILRYFDRIFLLYRENYDSVIKVTTFNRAGQVTTNWNIGDSIKGKSGILIMKDRVEEMAPSLNKPSATYIFVPGNTIIYHEMNYRGGTERKKIYHTDLNLQIIDWTCFERNIFVVTPDRLMKFLVNQDKITKREEFSDFAENTYKAVGFTKGRVFVYVLRQDNQEILFAHKEFTTNKVGGHVHLKGRKLKIYNSGLQNYVVYVQDNQGKRKYYYLQNPEASKSSSLVWVEIPDVNRSYNYITQVGHRIHFVNYMSHEMYIMGGKKETVRYKTQEPILSYFYITMDQYIQDDQMLVVSDEDETGVISRRRLKLENPKVECYPEGSAIEKYIKFDLETTEKDYRFQVYMKPLGSKNFLGVSLYKLLLSVLIGFGITVISYNCFVLARTEKEFNEVNKLMGNTEPLENLNTDENDDDDNDGFGFGDLDLGQDDSDDDINDELRIEI